jgi:hypothetical protein
VKAHPRGCLCNGCWPATLRGAADVAVRRIIFDVALPPVLALSGAPPAAPAPTRSANQRRGRHAGPRAKRALSQQRGARRTPRPGRSDPPVTRPRATTTPVEEPEPVKAEPPPRSYGACRGAA